jgi:hypothetical protein
LPGHCRRAGPGDGEQHAPDPGQQPVQQQRRPTGLPISGGRPDPIATSAKYQANSTIPATINPRRLTRAGTSSSPSAAGISTTRGRATRRP